ncbi:MAG: hypothetical protein V2A73_03410, partial [Pseudomonadota bacterium]
KVPALQDDLKDATYELVAWAYKSSLVQSSKRLRNVDISKGPVQTGEWLPLPVIGSATAAGFSYTLAAGADLTSMLYLEQQQSGVLVLWTVVTFDGSTEVQLPTLASNPLGVEGALGLTATAIDLPEFSPSDCSFEALNSKLLRMSRSFAAL